MAMKRATSAGIIIYHSQSEQPMYLVLHYICGHWDFPKGHLEPEESMLEAAQRELQEETGLYADVHEGFTHTFDYFIRYSNILVLKTVSLFVGKTLHQDVVLSHEHCNYTWLPFPQALEQLTYENAREALRAAHEFLSKQ
jgi:8-oxo-dGTP pyrophosphatase MutT (NUDIX family)